MFTINCYDEERKLIPPQKDNRVVILYFYYNFTKQKKFINKNFPLLVV